MGKMPQPEAHTNDHVVIRSGSMHNGAILAEPAYSSHNITLAKQKARHSHHVVKNNRQQ